jgi:hypothetical protein
LGNTKRDSLLHLSVCISGFTLLARAQTHRYLTPEGHERGEGAKGRKSVRKVAYLLGGLGLELIWRDQRGDTSGILSQSSIRVLYMAIPK